MSPVSTISKLITCSLVSICSLLGCSGNGDPAGAVAGQLTLKSEPFSDCKVAIYCLETSRSLASKVRSDGTFAIEDVPPGDYVVMVLPIPKDTPEGKPDPPDTSPIPKKFRTRERSDVSVTVVANEVGKVEIELRP
jgi:hypothetical protein